MIPGVNLFLKKFYEKKTDKNKQKKTSNSILSNDVIPHNNFEDYFNEILPQQILGEFEGVEPDNLIDQIVVFGKKFSNGRRQEDLAQYKYYLSGFLALCLHNSYRLGIIKKKGWSDEEFESKLTLIFELKKRYIALTQYILNSQTGILKLIDEIEGLLINIKV